MTLPHDAADPVHDVVVVGAGLAGLSAAWSLRDLDVVVLEGADRVGGRIRSIRSDPYWANLGAHMAAGPGTPLGDLAAELGLTTLPIPGVTIAVEEGGRVVASRAIASYPFRLTLPVRDRIALCRVGIRVVTQMARYNRVSRQRPGETPEDRLRRQLAFLGDRTFADFLGPLPPTVAALFRAIAHRATAAPEDLSAGCGISMLAHVFTSSGDSALSYAVEGGTEELPRALSARLGSTVRVGCRVRSVAADPDGVVVVLVRDGVEETVRARRAVVATTADVARDIVADLPADLDAALAGVRYGPFVSMGAFTDEPRPAEWDDLYALATPGRSFDFLFNHASPLRSAGHPSAAHAGGGIMVFAGGPPAADLLARSDEEIRERFLADLSAVYPRLSGHVVRAEVQRWPHGNSFAGVGRAALQDALDRGVPGSEIFLAGDYVAEQGSMPVALQSGLRAADRVRRSLASPVP